MFRSARRLSEKTPWNMNRIIVWAWMQRLPYALGTRTQLWFGQGCTGYRMLLEHERNSGLGVDALLTALSSTRTELCFGHGCPPIVALARTRTLLWFAQGLATVCSWNTNGIMVWAWMHSWSQSLEHKHQQNSGLGMDALVTVCAWNTNGTMVWACMH